MRTRAQRLLNAVQRPEIYEEALIEPSGVPIALSIWTGESGAPCVVFLPGTMTHPLFYEEFLDGLAQAGLNVVGVHYEEHGKSPRVNRLFSFEDLVQNGLDAVGYASERFLGKVLILGSSQGAIVAMALAKDERVEAVFAHNVLDTRMPQSLRVTRFPRTLHPFYHAIPKAMRAVARALPRLPLPAGFYLQEGRIFGAEWTLEYFRWDPLGLRSYPLYFLASLFSADTSFLSSGEIRCPVVVIASTGDKLFAFDYTERVYEGIVAPSKEMLVFELDHHLIFNECVEEVLPSLAAKLEEYAAGLEAIPP
jgi:alpha-beta hydrolase superfamily lysophospholipase